MNFDFTAMGWPVVVGMQNSAVQPGTGAPAANSGPSMVGLPDGSQPPQTGSTGVPVAPGGAGVPAAPSANPFGGGFLLMMLGVFGLMILMQVFTGKKERKKREELMSSMKRGDRVQMSGGLVGTILEVRDDDLVIRLEEGKARVMRSAVVNVVKEGRGETPAVEVKGGKEKAAV